MALHGYTWHYMAIHGITWLHMAIHGYTWLYMAIHGNTVPTKSVYLSPRYGQAILVSGYTVFTAVS